MNRSAVKMAAMLGAAIDEFTEFGLGAATMEAVATRAEVSKRTLYKHFPNKQVLFDAVVELMLERISPLRRVTYDPARKFAPQLREIAREEMELICDQDFVRLSRIILIESMRSEEQAQRLMLRFSTCECAMYSWFAAAAAAGALGETDPRLAADLFMATLKGLAYWEQAVVWQAAPTPDEQTQIVDEACSMLLWRIRKRQASGD